MKKLSKEDREKIADELRYPFGCVELQCDQFMIHLKVQSRGERRQTIVVYVDGWLRGTWLIDDCEERRRFMRKVERFVFPAKSRASFLKEFGKRAFKRNQMDQKIVGYDPTWNSVTTMLRQFQRTCDSVELVAIGYVDCNKDVRVEKLSAADIEQRREEANA